MNNDKPDVPKIITIVFAAIFGCLLLFIFAWDIFFWLMGMTS